MSPIMQEACLRNFDFSSWESILTTVIGLALFTLIGIGIRLLIMVTIQQRQQRLNRQINERLRTLMAAYKVLGGSFTGTLTVDPTHLRELRAASPPQPEGDAAEAVDVVAGRAGSDRSRQIRDAVEASLSDILLLGTEEQVRLAERAVRELLAGHPLHTHDLVVSLRNFIREALDLDPIPADLTIPMQGPTRPSGASGRGRGEGGGERGGQGGGGGMGGGGGVGMGGMGGDPDAPDTRR
jgi:uncharacterized membrane protein YgcG